MNGNNLWRSLACMFAFILAGCATDTAPPPDLDVSTTRSSAHKLYTVAIAPVVAPVAINKMHAWQIVLTEPSGKPVTNALIGIGGGMPQHSHGFPTQPKVTKELGGGRYLLEGMKFSMSGWWEIKLDIKSTLGADQATFNTVVPTSVKPI